MFSQSIDKIKNLTKSFSPFDKLYYLDKVRQNFDD